MRPIIFRGYSKRENCWFYGNLKIVPGEMYFIENVTEFGLKVKTRVVPESVGQYIGFEDANEKPIFEGDIVTDSQGLDYEIKWSRLNAMFTIEGSGNYDNFEELLGEDFEITGNVYEESEGR